MSDIFISYAREDIAQARSLAKAFQSSGWSVFWDRTIPTGKTWREVVGSELESARCVVVAWSESSIKSRYVLEEADRRSDVLAPVLIETVNPPLGFGGVQAANLVGWNGQAEAEVFKGLVSDIEGMIGPAVSEGESGSRPDQTAIETKQAAVAEALGGASLAQGKRPPVGRVLVPIGKEQATNFFSSDRRKLLGAVAGLLLLVALVAYFWGEEVPDGAVILNNAMWTIEDSGESFSWNDAAAYCRDLTLGGYNWGLPTLDQLEALYPEDVTDPAAAIVHIMDPIHLTYPVVWSSELLEGSDSAWYFVFDFGFRDTNPIFYQNRGQALCVRVPDE